MEPPGAASSHEHASLAEEQPMAQRDAQTLDSKHLQRPALTPVLRRVSLRILPVFFLLNCLNYLDRTSLAFAALQMSSDLGLTQQQYGLGAGLFFVGYSLCQVPSQLVLRHVGAPIWLAAIVTAWGVIASCMASVRGPATFYALRLLLGAAESGSFPGCWFYLTRFYPDRHITLPYSVTDSAIMFAQVVGAPLAAGVLQLNGNGGLAGWQWLFLVEGIPTAVLGLLLPALLPRSPAAARWLSAEQADTVQHEVDACRGADALSAPGGVWPLLRSAFTSGPMALLGLVKFSKDFASYGVMFWAPSLIRNLLHLHETGEDSCAAWRRRDDGARATGYLEVLLTGIPYSIAAVMNLLFAWNSQRTGDRRWHMALAYMASGLVCALLPLLTRVSVAVGFAGLSFVIVFSLCANGCMLALASAAGQGQAMALKLAVFNSIGNAAGLFGPVVMGYVVGSTCSYDGAFITIGVILMLGGALSLAVRDQSRSKSATLASSPLAMEMVAAGKGSGEAADDVAADALGSTRDKHGWRHHTGDVDIADEL